MSKKLFSILSFLLLTISSANADDGYRLWLKYDRISNQGRIKEYTATVKSLLIDGDSKTLNIAKEELKQAINGLLGTTLQITKTTQRGTIIAGTRGSATIKTLSLDEKLDKLDEEGYLIYTTSWKGQRCIVIAANDDVGVLYGTFHFIRLLQTHQNIQDLSIESSPKIKHRLLNHWDNLDRTVERGYAGFSLWDWHKLPDYIDPRYHDYARANASIGINGTVLTNVNANAQILTEPYLKKVAALADVFRPYGIRVYLTARFSAPREIGRLPTADPLDNEVQAWWKKKTEEIYRYIPDFGGFLVKANSEGQPGPQDYQRNHADGANMLAEALAPHKGIVMWRAFVYDHEVPEDRVKQAYSEFKPLDGKFRENVLVQVKNGPLDFQPREPFHPLFGGMPKTPLMMEFQITQEYLGFATHLVYLAPLFKECLDADTHTKGNTSTVAKVIDGSLDNLSLTGMAGVANIGNDRNWCGHPFGQANWYAFGRLAWNHEFTSEQIADEWIRSTFSNQQNVITTIKNIMLSSREILVQYMTPLGLHHIMGWNHHYGPAPWISPSAKGSEDKKDKPRADWTSLYYHRADDDGIGFNRTSSGSHALEQYHPKVREQYETLQSCPEQYLLWYHHVRWNNKMKSGRTLWDELCHSYYQGADSVRWMQKEWDSLEGKIDTVLFSQVKSLLAIQQKEAVWWRNACVLYFQIFSKREIPATLEKPDKTLEYYQRLEFPFAPGIRPRW